ncbi:MAG: OmpA family protein [Cyclobacteriaceae bacterium]
MTSKLNLMLLLFFSGLSVKGQPSPPKQTEGFSNHVVIGAFGKKDNAINLVSASKEAYPDVAFEINPDRGLHYVYVLKSDDRVQAFALARKLRRESKHWDTWVFYGALGEEAMAGNSRAVGIVNDNEVAMSDKSDVKDRSIVSSIESEKQAAEVKALSMKDESEGLDLGSAIRAADSENKKKHYETIQSVKEKAVGLDASTKVIVFKNDEEGREALRSLGYEIDEDKPVAGFFDSKNNILAINATESQTEQPFHEGLKPVVKFLRKKNPDLFQKFAAQASEMKHPSKGKTYGELTATPEEALGNLMADVATGFYDNADELRGEASELMGEILKALGVEPPDVAISNLHLKATANNLAVAVREATGFDAEGNRNFRFRLFNTVNGRKVNGSVELVNEAGKKLDSYEGNELVQVKRSDASGEIVLACEVLGYRKLLFKVNYDNPFLTDGVEKGEDEEAIIPFGLVRLQKGDIAVMYNVYFFKDAAIIRPESKYEINNLLDMMRESDTYKIRIHGHTNGNAAGKIITMGESKNYFSLSDTNEQRGSAKKLSEERANVIREYLADNGVGDDRMEVKAWGGSRALYDKNHSLAQSNVRVEIEILEN